MNNGREENDNFRDEHDIITGKSAKELYSLSKERMIIICYIGVNF
jgi:hypothetical protein